MILCHNGGTLCLGLGTTFGSMYKNMFLFSLGVKGNFCALGVPNLLVGSIYHAKNEGYLLEVFMMRYFDQTLSMYSGIYF